MNDLTENPLESLFGEEGLLSQKLAKFEFRPGQLEMAEKVSDAFQNKNHLIVEAGTGTGKTLAYLVPALASALSKNERVIISTGTKALQEQLMEKDVPFLKELFPEKKLKVTYMKGRSNYACIQRIEKAADQPLLDGLKDIDYFEEIRHWIEESETGDRSELTHLPENLGFWGRVNAKSDTCIGQKCEDFDRCFVTRMRNRAEESDIVVVNHHLFFADLNVRNNEYGQVIPGYNSVVLDEAHMIEDIAADYFGFQVSNFQLEELARDISNLGIPDAVTMSAVSKSVTKLIGFSDIFWSRFKEGRGKDGRFKLDKNVFFKRAGEEVAPTPLGEAFYHIDQTLVRIEKSLASFSEELPEADGVVRRVRQLRFNLDFVVEQSEDNYVYWLERRNRGVFLRASPIDVSSLLADKLFEKVETVVMTSATLSSGGDFKFIKSRLGAETADSFLAPSSFDYASQALIYLPPNMPEPRDPDYLSAAAREIVTLLKASEGRAFVLSTSFYGMNSLFELVSSRIGYPCFVQGSMSKSGLIRSFKKSPNSVLFGTASFWQGVDVPGEDLSCVIIDKLPFAVPTDPLTAARTNFIDSQGGKSFFDYSVPNAVITLKQGVGRLIRRTTDSGVIALLDARLRTKRYGRDFLKSMPNAPITTEMSDVENFFRING